jgi:undecaprenyl-diphosphatase
MHPTSSGTTGYLTRRFAEADVRIGHELARLRGNPRIDRVAYGISEVANHSILWHGINLIDLLGGLARGDSRRCQRALRRSMIQGIEQAVINGPVKALVKRQRPTEDLSHPHQLRAPLTSSFPSGHATAGACAAELLARDLGHRGSWWTLAVLVGWSRVHVGVHHPSDVLAGWAVGAAAAYTTGQFWPSPGSAPAPGSAPLF